MPTQITTFAEAELTMRFRSPFVTATLNEKMAVNTPPGVYRGFRLGTNGANDTVTIEADADYLDHAAVFQTDTGYSVTVRKTTGDFPLDLSSVVDAAEKTWVIALYGTYAVGATTAAEIRVYELSPTDEFTGASEIDELVVLGTVTIPAGGGVTIPAANITHARRTSAWENLAKEAIPWAPLIRNAGFEWSDDNAGNESVVEASLFWEREGSGASGWITDLVNVDKGNRAVSFTYDSGTPSAEMYQWQHLPVEEGQTIKLKLRKKTLQIATAGSAEMFVELSDEDGAGATSYTVTLDLSAVEGSFSTVEGSVKVPIGSGHTQLTRVGVSVSGISFGSSGLGFAVDSMQAWLEVDSVEDLDITSSRQGVLAGNKVTLLDSYDLDQGVTPRAGFFSYDSATNKVLFYDKDGNNLGLIMGQSEIDLAAGPNWLDATTNPAERVDQRLDSIITDLVANEGASRIAVDAPPFSSRWSAGDSIQTALNDIDTALTQWTGGVDLPLEAARSIQLTGVGGAGAWSYAEVGTDIPGWNGGGNSQVLIVPINAADFLEITSFYVYGSGEITARLIESSHTTRTILASDTGNMGTSIVSTVSATGIGASINPATRRYWMELYTSAAAGARDIYRITVSFGRVG